MSEFLLGILASYTLTTQDGGEIAPRILSAVFLLGTAIYFAFLRRGSLRPQVPVMCLLAMTAYGTAATLWWPSKIVYNGWNAVVFWLTASAITQIAADVSVPGRLAARFRFAFVVFGGAVCLLDLLEQASATTKYFWLIPSKYGQIFGSFAYWNNFAEFVELLLPLTLWAALGQRRPRVAFLPLAAIEVAAVVSCGSRAGTALVVAEAVAMTALAYRRFGDKRLLLAAAALCVFIALFAASAGYGTLATKLQTSDQLAVRRDLNRSSLALFRQRPLTGWGLGTYSDVYPSAARYDDGSWVNRAHNDWLQSAVEGGIPFALLMLIVVAWSIVPAVRSIWGIGVIAVAIHAAVDYPFARFGVCGWYFALLGMLIATGQERQPMPALNTHSSSLIKKVLSQIPSPNRRL